MNTDAGYQESPLPLAPGAIRRHFQELRWQERNLSEQLENSRKKIAGF